MPTVEVTRRETTTTALRCDDTNWEECRDFALAACRLYSFPEHAAALFVLDFLKPGMWVYLEEHGGPAATTDERFHERFRLGR